MPFPGFTPPWKPQTESTLKMLLKQIRTRTRVKSYKTNNPLYTHVYTIPIHLIIIIPQFYTNFIPKLWFIWCGFAKI